MSQKSTVSARFDRFSSSEGTVSLELRSSLDLFGQRALISGEIHSASDSYPALTSDILFSEEGLAVVELDLASLTREEALFVLAAVTPERFVLENGGMPMGGPYQGNVLSEPQSIVLNPTEVVNSPTDVEKATERISENRTARYSAEIGDDSAQHFHRAVFLIEGINITRPILLAHGQLLPLGQGFTSEEVLHRLNSLLPELGIPAQIESDEWNGHVGGRRPITVLNLNPFKATSLGRAIYLAEQFASKVMAVSTLIRGSAGRIAASVVVGEDSEDGNYFSFESGDRRLDGNVIGGMLAGESNEDFYVRMQAVNDDPVVELATYLYRDAIAETDEDPLLFKLWLTLEFLATSRNPDDPKRPVRLVSGEDWPDKRNGILRNALAASYFYLTEGLTEEQMHSFESQFAGFGDTYEFLSSFYGRRNAIVHYGRFIPDDDRQKTRSWYESALASLNFNLKENSPGFVFLAKNLVQLAIMKEMNRSRH